MRAEKVIILCAAWAGRLRTKIWHLRDMGLKKQKKIEKEGDKNKKSPLE